MALKLTNLKTDIPTKQCELRHYAQEKTKQLMYARLELNLLRSEVKELKDKIAFHQKTIKRKQRDIQNRDTIINSLINFIQNN